MIRTFSIPYAICAAVCACSVSALDETDPADLAPEDDSAARPASEVGPLSSYTDPRFHFSFDYPASWRLHERIDRPDSISGVLTIEATDSPGGVARKIHIGHFLQEIEPAESLMTWERRLPQVFSESERRLTAEHAVTLRRSEGIEARYFRGRSPLTEFQYVTLRHGALVWFVWANWGDSAEVRYRGIFDLVWSSFRIAAGTPRSLREVVASMAVMAAPPQADAANTILTTSWWSPVLGTTEIPQWPVTCGSSAHTMGAQYAADIAAPSGHQVLATRVGSVEAAGWDSSGYGNLVKLGPLDGVGRRHLYGHLQGISWPVLTLGYRVPQGDILGWVGNTGNVSGTHLHFHVQSDLYQTSSTGISLIGMWGFTDNPNDSYYPSNDGVNHYNCAAMGR